MPPPHPPPHHGHPPPPHHGRPPPHGGPPPGPPIVWPGPDHGPKPPIIWPGPDHGPAPPIIWPGPNIIYPNKGPNSTGSTNTGSTNTGSTNTGSSNTGSTNTGSTNTGSTNTGSTNTGSTNTGSTNTGSTNTGSTNTGQTNPNGKPDPGPKPGIGSLPKDLTWFTTKYRPDKAAIFSSATFYGLLPLAPGDEYSTSDGRWLAPGKSVDPALKATPVTEASQGVTTLGRRCWSFRSVTAGGTEILINGKPPVIVNGNICTDEVTSYFLLASWLVVPVEKAELIHFFGNDGLQKMKIDPDNASVFRVLDRGNPTNGWVTKKVNGKTVVLYREIYPTKLIGTYDYMKVPPKNAGELGIFFFGS